MGAFNYGSALKNIEGEVIALLPQSASEVPVSGFSLAPFQAVLSNPLRTHHEVSSLLFVRNGLVDDLISDRRVRCVDRLLVATHC